MRLPVYKLKLVRSGWMAYPPIDLRQPQLAAFFFHRLIGQAAVEHSAAIFLDPLGQFTGSTIVSIGDLARVQVLAREVFKAAMLANASGLTPERAWQARLRPGRRHLGDELGHGAAAGDGSDRVTMRRSRDSNPGNPCEFGGFQNRCLRPLGHSSKYCYSFLFL